MTKFYSDIINFVAFTTFVLIMLIGSGTSQASPSNSNSLSFVNSQCETVELSAWPRIRDGLLGRNRYYPPPPPPPTCGGRGGYPPPPPPPPILGGRGGYPPPPPPPPPRFRR